jgi:thiamine biosynthesis protein ThiI
VSGSSDEQVVLVSSAEFVLKSSPVRRTLEQRLVDDLRFALRRAGFRNFTMKKTAGRIIIKGITDAPLAAQTVARVFGVAYATPATEIQGSMETVLSALVRIAAETITTGQSFAIRCHRSSPSCIPTRDLEREGGSEILRKLAERNIKVNLNQPHVLISVDLFDENAYVHTIKLAGPGGLPLSSRWKMLAVLDSGPLSLFAAYVMMRRGCIVQLLIPSSTTNDRFPLDRQLVLARKLRHFVTRESYPGFVLELDKTPYCHKHVIRSLSLEIARGRRFRGVVLADVSGSIALQRTLVDKSQELGLPMFQPLIGFEATDLMELCRLLEVDASDLQAELAAAYEPSQPVNHLNLGEFAISEISL